jgi:hypothetical protein
MRITVAYLIASGLFSFWTLALAAMVWPADPGAALVGFVAMEICWLADGWRYVKRSAAETA